jgi:hypothetical protein
LLINILVFKDDRKPKDRQQISNGNILEFRRRHSSLTSTDQMTPSIISRPAVFRTNFRPSSVQARDYSRKSSKIIFFSVKERFCFFV